MPRKSACGTVWSTKRWRSSSFDRILIFHCADCALCTELASGGPNIISDGHHQRLSASCAIAFCSGVPAAELHHDVEALPLVEALFLADADHRARIRAERAAAQRNLVHDRRAVDQPADRADVGPGQRRIVEDARILGLAGMQVGDQLVARHAERLGRAVEIEPVARFVLDLGHQDRLALQGRRARDPVALGQHADDLRVRMLRNLPDQRLAIGLGHPVLGLDLDVGVDSRLERALLRRHLLDANGASWRRCRPSARTSPVLLAASDPVLAAGELKRYTFAMIMAISVSDGVGWRRR